MNKFTDINMYLKSTIYATQRDRETFTSWERKEITTKRALKQFMQNNQIRDNVFIGEGHFESWLNSLGYIRGKI